MLGAVPHIISFNMHSNFARYYDPHFIDELQESSPQVMLLVSVVTFLKISLTRITLIPEMNCCLV